MASQSVMLSDAAPRITDQSLLILDLSDLHNKYAKKMEHLATVHDGSGHVIRHILGYFSQLKANIKRYESRPRSSMYMKPEQGFH